MLDTINRKTLRSLLPPIAEAIGKGDPASSRNSDAHWQRPAVISVLARPPRAPQHQRQADITMMSEATLANQPLVQSNHTNPNFKL